MKNKAKAFSFLLAMVVFFSSTGHVFSLHFCKMEQSGCKKETGCCCSESAEPENNLSVSSPGNCCFNSIDYIINPFSVREPENQLSKIKVIAAEVRLFSPFFSDTEHNVFISYLFSDDVAPPPGFDLLTMISTFQI